MYFNRFQQQSSLLQIDDNFATLLDIRKGENPNELDSIEELVFNFSFAVSQLQALEENALSVLITVKNLENYYSTRIIPTTRKGIGFFNSRDIISNILTNRFKVFNSQKSNKNLILVQKTADITSKINNQIITAQRQQQNLTNLENLGIKKTRVILKKKREEETLGNFNQTLAAYSNIGSEQSTLDARINNVDKKIRLKLLDTAFKSPASVTELSNKTLNAVSNVFGTAVVRGESTSQPKALDELRNLYLKSNDLLIENSKDYEVVLEEYYDDTILIDTPILIKDIANIDSQLVVQFDLLKTVIDKNGKKETITVSSISKSFDVHRYISTFFLKNPPYVSLSQNSTSDIINIELPGNKGISNVDVKVYKKDLDDDYTSKYSLLATSQLNDNEQTKIYSFLNDHKSSIYRIVIGDSKEFSDVMTRTPRREKTNKVVVVPTLDPEGIKVSLYGTEKFWNLSSQKILFRDTTTKEKNFRILDPISSPAKGTSRSTTVISGLTPYHVYEIKARLLFLNGVEIDSSYSSFIEYVPYIGNLLDVRIEQTSVTEDVSGQKDVQFSAAASLLEDQVGLLNRLLDQVSAQYDRESLLKRNAEFDKFVAFNIVRYDTTSGEVENMGIIANNDTFIDSARSSLYNANRLMVGHNYKYVIYPLVRDPKTITETKVEMKDEETQKTYFSNFRKNRHPLALNTGTALSDSFLDNDSKDDMLYGMIGTSYELDVSMNDTVTVLDVLATTFDRDKILLNWSLEGNIELLDHFIIMREVNGASSIVGKSHCFDNKLSFIYEKTQEDVGRIRFSLIPIYQDYSSAPLVQSNYLLIEN